MLLVIFGAGASHDSQVIPPGYGWPPDLLPPPLASQLVDARYDRIVDDNPAARGVVSLLRERKAGSTGAESIEQELARIADEAETSIELRRQLLAFRLHLWNLIHRQVDRAWAEATHGQTHYINLLNLLLRWRQPRDEPVRLATFNYDCLLDQAATDVVLGWTLDSFDSYIDRRDFRLYKLHGSTAWSRQLIVDGPPVGRSWPLLLRQAAAIHDKSGDLVHEAPSDELRTTGDGNLSALAALPAMAVPIADKSDFECPVDHLDSLRSDLPHVDRVLVIGWRAAEKHAVALLDALNPGFDLGIVTKGTDSDSEMMDRLGSVGRRARVQFVFREGFSPFVAHGMGPLREMLSLQR